MESHEDDIFFLPRKFDDVVLPSSLSSSSSSSSEIEDVRPSEVRKRTNTSAPCVNPNRRSRGKRSLTEDSTYFEDNCSEDVLERSSKLHEFEGLLSKLEEGRRRLKLFDEVEGPPCDSTNNTAHLISTDSQDLGNVIVKLQSDSFKEVFCIRRNTTMKTLLMACCKRWGLSECNTQLYFDGRIVSSDSTPESLELENEDVIDVVVCN
ncbi:hypothetical protein GpartN1_g7452.t1 [Galdieria partita]|uniref:Rad60/SUMO-like domain-containing protein n=1 Tax=Galdieria partita TaxID=83374 RepID=A0A9C7Q5Z2_9RHOD|nr:hypothetical protein GpartN1_g7452.t1 [Galdieria partita]